MTWILFIFLGAGHWMPITMDSDILNTRSACETFGEVSQTVRPEVVKDYFCMEMDNKYIEKFKEKK